MSWRARLVLLGGAAEVVVAGLAAALAGISGFAGALAGGVVASAAQLGAVALLRPGMRAPGAEFVRRWASGIALRGASALLVVGLVLAARPVLAPLWTALGFLGVMLTLLYAETRFLQ